MINNINNVNFNSEQEIHALIQRARSESLPKDTILTILNNTIRMENPVYDRPFLDSSVTELNQIADEITNASVSEAQLQSHLGGLGNRIKAIVERERIRSAPLTSLQLQEVARQGLPENVRALRAMSLLGGRPLQETEIPWSAIAPNQSHATRREILNLLAELGANVQEARQASIDANQPIARLRAAIAEFAKGPFGSSTALPHSYKGR